MEITLLCIIKSHSSNVRNFQFLLHISETQNAGNKWLAQVFDAVIIHISPGHSWFQGEHARIPRSSFYTCLLVDSHYFSHREKRINCHPWRDLLHPCYEMLVRKSISDGLFWVIDRQNHHKWLREYLWVLYTLLFLFMNVRLSNGHDLFKRLMVQ